MREEIMHHQNAKETDALGMKVRAMSKIGEVCFDKAGGFVAWVQNNSGGG